MLSFVVSVLLAGASAGAGAGPAGKGNALTKAGVDRVKGGMTLAEVMAVFGPRAEINPGPAPLAASPGEVLVVWRDGKAKWAGVVFVPDEKRVLRVLDTGETNIDWGGFGADERAGPAAAGGGSGSVRHSLPAVARPPGVARGGAAAADEKPPRVPAERLKAALADADAVFEGKVVEADLTDGFLPGFLGIDTRRVVYEVTDPVKGKPGKKVEAWLLLLPGEAAEYLDPKAGPGAAPRLDPELFAAGSVHLVYCLSEEHAVGG
jgi:hypothetical protein